ncbi:hypothetical protein E8L90_29670 [Brevibacillus antibioticus]|uniref:Uncharacterized protein n=1 Tax=Brevibacillus antibioticus TaxID=2570228 RepID=A0A4U2XYE7_9BACL|nr:hypothetical protein [Brevibacillus antibioticus]TKI52926.1 hypothetical protein E8L90_29670 [Brevibacillus antibioticus]
MTPTQNIPKRKHMTQVVRMNAKTREVLQGIPLDYEFISIHNPTNNTIAIYEGQAAEPYQGAARIAVIQPYQANTFPIPNRSDFTLAFTDGGGSTTDIKEISVVFSVENLGINTMLGVAGGSTVTLTADAVGLARGTQLPTQLHTNGGLKVHVLNSEAADTNFYSGALSTTDEDLFITQGKTRLESVTLSNDDTTDKKATINVNGFPLLAIVPSKGSVVVDAPLVVPSGVAIKGKAESALVYVSISGKVIS